MIEIYLEKWQLNNPVIIASTHTSDVYKVKQSDGTWAILKYLNETGRKDEAAGCSLLKWYSGKGSVNLINADEGAHLLEYADGEELAEWVYNGKDKKATEIICDVVRELHRSNETQIPTSLVSLDVWFRELFSEAKNSSDETIILAAKTAQYLFETTDLYIPLHGDLHHHNIMNSKRGWFAIDPKGLVGDPCYDLANFYGNPMGKEDIWLNPERVDMLTETFVNKLGYLRDRIIKFAFIHNVISTVWNGEAKLNREDRFNVAKRVYSML